MYVQSDQSLKKTSNYNKPENPFQTMTSLWIGNIYMNLDMHRNLQDIWSWNFIYTLQKKRHFTEKETKKKVWAKRIPFRHALKWQLFYEDKRHINSREPKLLISYKNCISNNFENFVHTLRRKRHFTENETLYGERDKKVWKERSLEASAFKWQFFYKVKNCTYLQDLKLLISYKNCLSNSF